MSELKPIAIAGSDGRIIDSYKLRTPDLLSAVGNNSGNLVFQRAVHGLIAAPKLTIGKDIPWDPRKVSQQCSHLVIPAANFIREGFKVSGFVDFIEKCQLPVTILGLGSQAPSINITQLNLDQSVLRLVQILRERSNLISVRGPHSAEVLSALGCQNLLVTGCPSNFLNLDPQLPSRLAAKWSSDPNNIMTNGDEPWPKDVRKRDVERKLVAWTILSGGAYVQQSVEPFVSLIRSNNSYQDEQSSPTLIKSLINAIAPTESLETFRRFLGGSVRVYFSVDQWMEDASRFDLSIGLRLHGNMVPFQSGTPAIWIHHDSRTKELVDTMALPSVSIDEVLASESPSDLLKAVNFDMAAYEIQRQALARRMARVLDASGIAHNLGGLIDSSPSIGAVQ